MSYVAGVLQPGETIVYRGGLHWLVYGRAILMLIVSGGITIASGAVTGGTETAFLYAAGIAFLVAVVDGIGAAIRRATTELVVTTQRVIYKQGLFGRHTIEMNRSKVESVDVDQSFLGRIFGFGTILVRGTGGGLEPLQNIADPLALRTSITVG